MYVMAGQTGFRSWFFFDILYTRSTCVKDKFPLPPLPFAGENDVIRNAIGEIMANKLH